MNSHTEILRGILNYSSPFSSSVAIIRRSNARYLRMMKFLSNRFQNDWADILQSKSKHEQCFILRSPSLRISADHLAMSLDNPQLEREAWILRMNDLFDGLRECGPSLERSGFSLFEPILDEFPFVTSAWSETGRENVWNEFEDIKSLFEAVIPSAGAEDCVLRHMESFRVEQIEKSIKAMMTLLPELIAEIAVNVRLIALIDYARWKDMDDSEYREIGESMSRHCFPSTIFLSLHAFRGQSHLVDSLFHEALHRKLGNIFYAYSIFRNDYDAYQGPRFECLWNTNLHWNSNRWPFDRALDAYHVYVHLFIFYGMLLEQQALMFGEPDEVRESRERARERAEQLGTWLGSNACDCLEKEGVLLLRFLSDALQNSIEAG